MIIFRLFCFLEPSKNEKLFVNEQVHLKFQKKKK